MDSPEGEAAGAITARRWDALDENANELARIAPTTLAGVKSLIRYVAGWKEWQAVFDQDWYQVFLTTLANALDTIERTQQADQGPALRQGARQGRKAPATRG
jgi:hypothetical protein